MVVSCFTKDLALGSTVALGSAVFLSKHVPFIPQTFWVGNWAVGHVDMGVCNVGAQGPHNLINSPGSRTLVSLGYSSLAIGSRALVCLGSF